MVLAKSAEGGIERLETLGRQNFEYRNLGRFGA
jgi:hypothetical protein